MPAVRRILPALALALALALPSAATAQPTVQDIVDAAAGSLVARGEASGVAVGVVMPRRAPRLFTYGQAVAGEKPFATNTLFEIGSVTKVFTTNLFGQRIDAGTLRPDTPLRDDQPVLGPLKRGTRKITLRQLADFTSGMPDYAPLCSKRAVPGCLPSSRPDMSTYGAADFAAFFRGTRPKNYQADPPQHVKDPPAPYLYSDYSLGLLGLLLGATPGSPIDDSALAGWLRRVERRILEPLRMEDTVLFPPAGDERLAAGYDRALATPVVSGGEVTGATIASRGGSYDAAPAVSIVGGGGSGATAIAHLEDHRVHSVEITHGGSGYVDPADIAFAGSAHTPAKAHLVVEGGRVVAVVVTEPGSGYAAAPAVTVTGGRAIGGGDATLVAKLFNGGVVHVGVSDGGEGYVEPLSIVIAPGAGLSNTVPIWAPAGALHSTIADMARFTAAALGRLWLDHAPVPKRLRAGFAIAQTPSACTGPDPALAACLPGEMLSAFAWAVEPADTAAGGAARRFEERRPARFLDAGDADAEPRSRRRRVRQRRGERARHRQAGRAGADGGPEPALRPLFPVRRRERRLQLKER